MKMSEIKADFKQATVKGRAIELKFEILSDAPGAFDIARKTGDVVLLSVLPAQEELDFDGCTGRPANVDCETGEVYEVVEDESHMIERW